MEWLSETFDLFHSTDYEIKGRLKFSFNPIGNGVGTPTKVAIQNFSRVETLDVRVSWYQGPEEDGKRIHRVKPRGRKNILVPTVKRMTISYRYG